MPNMFPVNYPQIHIDFKSTYEKLYDAAYFKDYPLGTDDEGNIMLIKQELRGLHDALKPLLNTPNGPNFEKEFKDIISSYKDSKIPETVFRKILPDHIFDEIFQDSLLSSRNRSYALDEIMHPGSTFSKS